MAEPANDGAAGSAGVGPGVGLGDPERVSGAIGLGAGTPTVVREADGTHTVRYGVIVGPSPAARGDGKLQARELRDLLRSRMRGDLAKLLPELWAKYSAGDLNALQFAEFLAKYGLGQRNELDVISPDVVARLRKQAELIMRRETWTRGELIELQREVWGG